MIIDKYNDFTDIAIAQEMIKKAQLDPIYATSLPHLIGADDKETAKNLWDAGFFHDGLPLEDSAGKGKAAWWPNKWLATPLNKLTWTSSGGQKPVDTRDFVLLSTGAFCPIHSGHLKMMEIARAALLAQGKSVVGGYLSPSHDIYVGPKCGNAALNAVHRLRLTEEALKDSDWLMSCPWEALGTNAMVNFTEVMTRLKSYLIEHTENEDIEVAYVFGADNARFARAFVEKGSAVCVMRPGFEGEFYKYETLQNERIFFVDEASHDLSSRSIREDQGNKRAETFESTPGSFWQWQANQNLPRKAAPATIYLRQELDWATEAWKRRWQNRKNMPEATANFADGLANIMLAAHKASQPPDRLYDLNIEILSLSEQMKPVDMLARGHNVISLDPCIEGDVNLRVSRLFPMGDTMAEPSMVARPGAPSIEEQIEKIYPGEYILFDDDIFSGSTIRQVQELLPDEIKIRAVCALTIRGRGQTTSVLDILDCRDFLAGAREAGLVMQPAAVMSLGQGNDSTAAAAAAGRPLLFRAPYCLPYVSPGQRASIPFSSEIAFSRAIWRLNEEFHKQIDPPVLVSETNPGFLALMRKLGFSDGAAMETICRMHAENLEGMPA